MKKINTIDEIFKMPIEAGKHADYFLQTMLYAMIIRHDKDYNPESLPVSPALLFIQHTSEEGYDPTISIGKERIIDISDFEDEFTERLLNIITEIFEPKIPFKPTEDKSICEYCLYHSLCGR